MSSSDPDSRLLLLMRHGKAEGAAGQLDHDRHLAERGQAQADLIGEYLESQNVQVARVLISDSARTRETWEGVAGQLTGFDGTVTFEEDIYSGGVGEVLRLLHEVGDEHPVVMVVGHEPTIASLVSVLADDDSDAGSVAQARIGMPTGSLGILSGPLPHWADLGEESLTLHTIVRP